MAPGEGWRYWFTLIDGGTAAERRTHKPLVRLQSNNAVC